VSFGEEFATPDVCWVRRKECCPKHTLILTGVGCVIGPWAKLSVLLGRLLVMKRPRVRYCITFTGRSAGRRERTKLINNHRRKKESGKCGRTFPHAARNYILKGLVVFPQTANKLFEQQLLILLHMVSIYFRICSRYLELSLIITQAAYHDVSKFGKQLYQ
jgi:hypothetical protein